MTSKSRVRHSRRIYKKQPHARLWRWALWVAGVGGLVLVAVLFDSGVSQINHPRIDPKNVAQVEAGRLIYDRSCASCHGASLEGEPNWQQRLANGRYPAPALGATSESWRQRDVHLFAITKRGASAYPADYQTDMPAFGGELTDQEIAAVLAYIKSKWPADMQARQARFNLQSWTRTAH